LNSPDLPDHLHGVWGKLKGYGGRVALILRYLRWACVEDAGQRRESQRSDVEVEDVEGAEKLVNYFAGHARRAHVCMDTDARVAGAKKILGGTTGERPPQFKRGEPHGPRRSEKLFPPPDARAAPLEPLGAHNTTRPQEKKKRSGPGRRPAVTFD